MSARTQTLQRRSNLYVEIHHETGAKKHFVDITVYQKYRKKRANGTLYPTYSRQYVDLPTVKRALTRSWKKRLERFEDIDDHDNNSVGYSVWYPLFTGTAQTIRNKQNILHDVAIVRPIVSELAALNWVQTDVDFAGYSTAVGHTGVRYTFEFDVSGSELF
jgi:hypothetical protein